MTRAANHVFDLNKTEQIPLRWTAPEVCSFQIHQKNHLLFIYFSQGIQIKRLFGEEWCVQLWYGPIWNLVSWTKTVPSSVSKSRNCWLYWPEGIAASPSRLPQRGVQFNGHLLVSCKVHYSLCTMQEILSCSESRMPWSLMSLVVA